VAAIETGHAGQIQTDHCGLLSGSAACKWAPGCGVGQAKDGDGGSASRDRKVDERGVIADKEVNLLQYCRHDLDATSACQAAYRHC